MPTAVPRARAHLRRHLLVLLSMLVLSAVCYVQADQPRGTTANFKQAYKFSDEFLKKFVYSLSVTPNWIGKTDTFWYEYHTSRGKNWYRVNPQQATKEPLFDNAKVATALSEMTKKPLEPSLLPLTRVIVNDEGNKMKFVTGDFQYEYDLHTEKLAKLGKAPPPGPGENGKGGQFGGKKGKADDSDDFDSSSFQFDSELLQFGADQQGDIEDQAYEAQQKGKKGKGNQKNGQITKDGKVISPDGKLSAYLKDYNLFLKEAGKDDPTQLSKDCAKDYTFTGGGGPGGDGGGKGGKGFGKGPSVNWAKDSKSFYATRSDGRGVKDLYLINSVAQPRPTLTKYAYAMPGEEHIRHSELHIWSAANGKLVRVEPKWTDESYTDVHWGKNPGELRFTRHDRLIRNVEFCSLNVVTCECKCLIADGFENANIVTQPIKYLEDSDEMIWWSERSGWGHFYLYARDGALKNAITSGAYRASSEVAIDAKNRLFYFHGNSREEGENAYYDHLYSVHFDGSGLTLLDPGNGEHKSYLSPSRQFVVDNVSRLDMTPSAVLRDHRGAKVMDLATADLSHLFAVGWKMPEVFTVKAADGVTDLYGNMWKPFDFDPNKKYPIIAHVYPGPQQESMPEGFSPVNKQQQLAQLGFIVIQVGNRGGSPLRSKLYGSFGYWNLRDYALADKKTAIEQLAAQRSYIDIDRVGIYGHSGGGFLSAAAMLQKPYNDFFKVAVSSSGNHDNNIYNNSWAERYHGLKEVPIGNVAAKKDNKAKDEKKAGDDDDGSQDQVAQDKDQKVDQDKAAKKKNQKKDQKKDAGKEETKTKQATRFEIRVPTNAELAGNLKGKLLLVHGDMDNNVHPANTIRLVDALIKANKRFDMLILPGKQHAYADFAPYFEERMWEYFAENLLDARMTSADLYDKK